MEVEIINPLEYPGWDDLLLSQHDHSIFHTTHWARILHESYGYTPLYFTLFRDGALSALIPVMEVNSWITGRRAVSLPFTDYCEPIMTENGIFPELMEALLSQEESQSGNRLS
jgi:hypothetical protein